MGKRVHYNEPNHAHELTFSCYKRRRYLRSPIYCQFLCDAIQASRTKYSFDVWAYVFMPSHVHLLIYPTTDGYDIAKITQSIKQSVSRRVMNHAKEEGGELLENFRTDSKLRPYQFWLAGAGYDRDIVSRHVVLKSIDYIHNNPVRAGLVKSPEDWKWSSFRDLSDMGVGPIEIDRSDIPLS